MKSIIKLSIIAVLAAFASAHEGHDHSADAAAAPVPAPTAVKETNKMPAADKKADTPKKVDAPKKNDDIKNLLMSGKGGDLTFDLNTLGSITNCRSVGASEGLKLSASIGSDIAVECFAQWGCGGKASVEFKGDYTVKAGEFIGSCRLKDGKKKDGKGKGHEGGHEGHDHGKSTDSGNSTERSVHAAVLFEEKNYGGIKRWIDGSIGECRGLSGAPINSIKMVAFPGGDPFVNGIDDDVTLAFFDGYGCTGNLVGSVTGEHPSVHNAVDNCKKSATCCKDMGGNSNSTHTGNSTLNGFAYSVRFVKTGIENKFYSMNYKGTETASTSGASTIAAYASSIALAMTGALFASL